MEKLFSRLKKQIVIICLLCFAVETFYCFADFKKAISLYKRGKYQQAFQEIQPYLGKYPNWEFGHRLAALCLFKLKRYQKASKAFEKAIDLKSKESSVYLGLAECYYNLAQYKKSLDILQNGSTYIKNKRDQYNFHRISAYSLYKLGNFDKAIQEIFSAFQYQSGSAYDWLVLGGCYFKLGDYGKSSQAFENSLKLNPGLEAAQDFMKRITIKQGEKALKEKRYKDAENIFKNYVDKNPDVAGAKFNLALAEIGLKNWEDAENLFEQIENDYVYSFSYNFYRGYVLEKLGKNKEAKKFYQKAMEIKNSPQVKEALKRVKRRLGER